MENDAATLYCPNELCQSSNPLTHKFCLRCSTPLPKRYLWVQGEGLSFAKAGDILADRYLVIDQSVVLDIKPGFVPYAPELDSLSVIRPYLRLIPYRVHVPQVYGVIPPIDGRSQQEILLLEKPPLFADNTGQQVKLYPDLMTAWGDANSMRQLHWLWQIANLWQPLLSEGVATTLLKPDLIRLEGTLVRLLDLHFDSGTQPSLSELGQVWQQLHKTAKPAIAEFIHQVSSSLIAAEINSAEQLMAVLDQGLAQLGRSQTSSIKIFTKTDTGPSRQRNEDACYPLSGTLVTKPPQSTALAIVCDGIGGHEGGNVASNLAIETIQNQVQQLTQVPAEHIDPSLLLTDLESAVAIVNDKISQRNDSENRQGRQRMGTTLVMALPIAHEIYITHVGDSRAYWITSQNCYQVTLDDDVASREVRLGYAIYREATQQSGSGSLVQALGMSPSTSLHPTSQRFILDEDAVFLLTSDGLSDFDRVEDYWETEILPILKAEADIASVAEKLVEIANTKNGHDNVTIALVHFQVKYSEPDSSLSAVIPEGSSTSNTDPSPRTAQPMLVSNPDGKTKVIPDEYKQRSGFAQLPLQLLVPLILVAIVGGLGYLIMQWREGKLQIAATSPTPTLKPSPDQSATERNIDNLAKGWVIQANNDIVRQQSQEKFSKGTFFEVIDKQPKNPKFPNQDLVVNLRVCPNNEDTANPAKDNSVASTAAEKTVKIELSQLQSGVTVLQADQPNPCVPTKSTEPVNQPTVPSSQSEDDAT
ncbi:protein phosphatase 2C domain-containing protein [Tolypothrix sp. FACHB-123]|uniref:PP2C family protein-serine/threonine phosphatase n=1 Tax=Tolypothrix sp. FACHB-123 TaxID=2692868 RepID=UPI00168994C7|nr:protein phosphatase 2C domain-containing protein [Tolypothrix sp. FACHB-123]MBD2353409.1 protein phosphatase 2C domain-containing protein [Tolypothrix sp. FACHB-123]